MIAAILLMTAAMLVFVTLGITGWAIGIYNTFRVGQQDIKTQLSNAKTEYQRRMDLFINLAAGVKSFKKHENKTLREVIQARASGFGMTSLDAIKKMGKLDGLLSRMALVFENYPNLKSNEQHNMLMEEVRITEDRINIVRTDYNEIVGDYNKIVQMFPSNIIAGMFKFSTEPFFENEAGSDKAPKLDLE